MAGGLDGNKLNYINIWLINVASFLSHERYVLFFAGLDFSILTSVWHVL